MALPNFTIYNAEAIINNIDEIKSFNESSFIIKINEITYEITGNNLSLKEVTNDNKTIRILGYIESIINKSKSNTKNKNFIKKLFS